jgi:ribosomal-protein-alanine N-acetyltransferase
MTTTLQTDRLILRPFTLDDRPPFLRHIFYDNAVWNKISGGVVDDPMEEATNLITQWQSEPHPPFVIEKREDNAFLGYVALKPIAGVPEETELTTAVGSVYWRNGYATEACRAVLRHGFETCQHPRIYALLHPHNERGKRLAERLYFTFKDINRNYNYGEELAVYSLNKAVFHSLYL